MVFELPAIEDFYSGKVILITGVSGFLGRMSLEKLLRECPKIKKIYIMLRNKKEKDCAKRYEELFDSIVFDRLSKENPNYKHNVEMLVGDCSLPDLALRPEVKQLIINEVDVIIHWAATVKFDENLKVATNINVRALRDLIRIAKEMPQLKAFLHVSTAFSNCIRHDVDEIFYDTPISAEGLINMMEALDSKVVADITPNLLGKWPSTYVFTKAVAENLLRDEGRGLPLGMIRPSIVIGSYREPVPGWIDNIYGTTGILIGCAIGLLRIIQCDLSCIAEMMPADLVVNTALVAVVDIHHQHQKLLSSGTKITSVRAEEAMPIYNVVSSPLKAIDWKTFMTLSQKICLKVPSPKVLWHSHTIFTPYYYVYKVGSFFLHTIPAHVIDLVAIAIGKKPGMIRGYKKIHKFSETISYFATRTWTFHNNNVQKLFMKVQISDRRKFDFNIAIFDWNDYLPYYIKGLRAYILKDTLDTIPQGKRKLIILRIAHYLLCALILYAGYKLFKVVYQALIEI